EVLFPPTAAELARRNKMTWCANKRHHVTSRIPHARCRRVRKYECCSDCVCSIAFSKNSENQTAPKAPQRRANAPMRKPHEALAGGSRARLRAGPVHRSGPELSSAEADRLDR